MVHRIRAQVVLVALALAGCVYFPHSVFERGAPSPPGEPQASAEVAVPAGPSPLIPVPADTREIKAKRRSLARLERVLGLDNPVTITAAIELAQMLAAEGRQAEAEPLLTQTLEQVEALQGPTAVDVAKVAISLAEARLAAGREGEARTLAKRAAGILDENPVRRPAVHGEVLRRAARIQLRLGHLEQADVLFRNAYQTEFGAVPPDEPISELDPNRPVAVTIQDQLYADLLAGNKARAIIRLNTVIEEHPEMGELYLWRARVEMTAGAGDGTLLDPEAAEQDLRRAQELDPSLLGAYRGYAELFRRWKRLADAIEVASAGSADPASSVRLAELYVKAGDAEQAIEVYEGVVALDGALTASKTGLAQLLVREADGDVGLLDRALELARTARSEEPARAGVADTLGRVLVERKEADEAIPILLEALEGYGKMEPEMGPVRYALGRAYHQTEDLDRAIEQLEYAASSSFRSQLRAARLLQEVEAQLMVGPDEEMLGPLPPEGLAAENGLQTSYSSPAEADAPDAPEVPEGFEIIEEDLDDETESPDALPPTEAAQTDEALPAEPPEQPEGTQPPEEAESAPAPDSDPAPEPEAPAQEQP